MKHNLFELDKALYTTHNPRVNECMKHLWLHNPLLPNCTDFVNKLKSLWIFKIQDADCVRKMEILLYGNWLFTPENRLVFWIKYWIITIRPSNMPLVLLRVIFTTKILQLSIDWKIRLVPMELSELLEQIIMFP